MRRATPPDPEVADLEHGDEVIGVMNMTNKVLRSASLKLPPGQWSARVTEPTEY